MSDNLIDIIRRQIEMTGPMDLGQFMMLALTHPDHGYYMKKDPLGRDGDFTTAPEISQMFGEMIGVWLADMWDRMGEQTPFILLECGPGRGTLMADILRATKAVSGFHEKMQIHLLEISPTLKEKQERILKPYTEAGKVTWHADLSDVPRNYPVFFIANEFFDALPFRQFVFQQGGWHEKVIVLNQGESKGGQPLAYGYRKSPLEFEAPKLPQNGDVYEYAPARGAVLRDIAGRVKEQGGAGLIVDYGHIRSDYGETFQAVRGHEYCDPLEHVGNADLTSHVDFEALRSAALSVGVKCSPIIEQGRFLTQLGISVRAQALKKTATTAQQQDIEKSLHRLTASDQMGALFKVMGIYSDERVQPAGF